MATKNLVTAITEVATAARKLTNSRLKRNAVELLISQAMKFSERLTPRQVGLVLDAAENLDTTWLKPLRKSDG
jgi:hypothetical protein